VAIICCSKSLRRKQPLGTLVPRKNRIQPEVFSSTFPKRSGKKSIFLIHNFGNLNPLCQLSIEKGIPILLEISVQIIYLTVNFNFSCERTFFLEKATYQDFTMNRKGFQMRIFNCATGRFLPFTFLGSYFTSTVSLSWRFD